MLKENVSKLLNQQINKEMFSAYLYLDIANFYTNKGLNGFANWFKIQAKEEMDHAMIFITYLQNNDFEVSLDQIANPTKEYKNLKEPLEESLNHEQFVTASIHNIYLEAKKVEDFRTQEFLHWFIKEQGEEEKNATDLIIKYGWLEKNLYMLDHELSKREYSPADYDFD